MFERNEREEGRAKRRREKKIERHVQSDSYEKHGKVPLKGKQVLGAELRKIRRECKDK